MAFRASLLRHVRVPVQTLPGPKSHPWGFCGSIRFMSSHDDHLTREQVVDRVLDVVKSFPKVDPSKVTADVHFQKDLGLDSLDNVEIIMGIEEEFKLEIPDKEAVKIDSCNLAIESLGCSSFSSRSLLWMGSNTALARAICSEGNVLQLGAATMAVRPKFF